MHVPQLSTSANGFEGTYSLSGGHLEHGETFADCAKREVLEETGLEIEEVQFFTAVENFFHGEGDGKRHYVTIFVTAYVKKGAMTEAKVSFQHPYRFAGSPST